MEELNSLFLLLARRKNKKSCEGGACDLVYGDGVSCDIDEIGKMTVYIRDREVASRIVKFCPMCGKKFG